jgi:hypothetical protein
MFNLRQWMVYDCAPVTVWKIFFSSDTYSKYRRGDMLDLMLTALTKVVQSATGHAASFFVRACSSPLGPLHKQVIDAGAKQVALDIVVRHHINVAVSFDYFGIPSKCLLHRDVGMFRVIIATCRGKNP